LIWLGDVIEMFNWWVRLLSGLLAGCACARQIYSLLDLGFGRYRGLGHHISDDHC